MYFLKTGSWLAGFWLVYLLALRNTQNYSLNRWFLLTGILCAIILPFYSFRYQVQILYTASPEMQPIVDGTLAVISGQNTEKLLGKCLFVFYVSGILVVTSLSVIKFIRFKKMEKKGESITVNGTRVIRLQENITPFSFVNKIFIGSRGLAEKDVQSVVLHEKVHIDQKHWIDLFLIGMLKTLMWFNPLIALYRKSIMQNHEFLADRSVIDSGVNVMAYKALLVNQLFGVPVIGLANRFTSFKPKKRLEMMTKNNVSKKHNFRVLWILPVVAVLLYAFAEPRYVAANQDLITPETQKENVMKGVVVNETGEPMPGVSIVVANKTMGTVTDLQGKYSIGNILQDDKLVLSFVGYKSLKIPVDFEKLIVTTMEPTAIKMDLNAPEVPEKPKKAEKQKLKPKRVKPLKDSSDKRKPGKEKEVFYIVEDLPRYPEGMAVLKAQIINSFGEQILRNKTHLNLLVKSDGSVENIRFIPEGPMKQENLEKFKNSMSAWRPGMQRGKAVSAELSIKLK